MRCPSQRNLVAIPLATVLLSAKCVVEINLLKCEARSLPFFRRSFLDATCRAKPTGRCIWERLARNRITNCRFTSKYWRTFMNHPGIWFSSQQHWFVRRHVTLWQKMPVTSPISFPLDRTDDKWGILRQSWSRHVREPPNFFKCEVSAPFLVCKSFLGCSLQAQPRAGCKCKWERLISKPDHKPHLDQQVCLGAWHMGQI